MLDSKVVDIATKRKSLNSHSIASSIGAELLDALGNCEANDLIGTLRFDVTPADIVTIESFISDLKERTRSRLHGTGN